jgi:hypothetical protein
MWNAAKMRLLGERRHFRDGVVAALRMYLEHPLAARGTDERDAWRCQTRYLATVVGETLMPTFRSSLWMRGVPHSGLAG